MACDFWKFPLELVDFAGVFAPASPSHVRPKPVVDKTDKKVECTFHSISEGRAVTKSVDLTCEEVARYLSYDPLTGSMLRRERSGQRGAVGTDATTVRKAQNGAYRWVWLHGAPIPAARIAWLLAHGEWPETRVMFRNGDTLDIRLENLKTGTFKAHRVTGDEGRANYRRSRKDGREYDLKNLYGLTLGDHEHMLASQGGVCKVCHQLETRRHKDGDAVALHVDHDHVTGAVRGLLCHKCNIGLGSFDDDPQRLRAAADYIERHRARKKECA